MVNNAQQTLEQALTSTEADAAAALRAAGALMGPLRRFRAAAQSGNLRELHQSLEAAEAAIADLQRQFKQAKKGWSFDTQRYMASGLYAKEVLSTAHKMGVQITERDERMYCYPALVKVAPQERAVVVDRKRESRVRPSVLVNLLKDLQNKPPTFRPEAFLTALYDAYTRIVYQRDGADRLELAPVVPLVDIYALLTLLPGQAREYSRQEFARDIYLLHRGGKAVTKTGARVSFPISRGVRGKTLVVIDEGGEERRYYGIRVTPEGGYQAAEKGESRGGLPLWRGSGGVPQL